MVRAAAALGVVRERVRARLAPRIHLTFDDGPDPVWTPRVASALESAGTRGTFFVIGERASEHPDVVRDLVARGHEIELHCMRHVRHPDATRAEIEADTREAIDALARLGVRPDRWRTPGGGTASWTAAVARRHRLRIAGWSADPRDWAGDLAGVMLERAAPQLHPGAVVVMHDGIGPGAERDDCAQTVALVELVASNARARGFEVRPLGDRRALIDRARAFRQARAARRPKPAADPGVEIRCVSESEVTDDELRALSDLLAESMTRLGAEYRKQPWRRLRPEYRVLARVDGEIVGQVSAFRIGTQPPRELYGLGDLAVRPAHRGMGIADRLGTTCREEAWRRGAEIVLSDTVALKRRDLRLGYAPVPRFGFHYERDGACHWHPNWAAMIRHPEPRTRLRLDEGDF